MALEQALNDTLTQAIRDKDMRTANVVRMLKTKITERTTAKGFTGQVDDAPVTDVIGAYRKQPQKALAEYEKVGTRGAQQAEELRFEIAFCDRYLPKGLDEGAVRNPVRERIGALAIGDGKQIGRLVGDVMKTHKGQVGRRRREAHRGGSPEGAGGLTATTELHVTAAPYQIVDTPDVLAQNLLVFSYRQL